MSTFENKQTNQVVILAGGCFWGVQDIIRKIPGIIHTEVGYTGGQTKNPTYPEVKTGKTGHAEAIKITYDSTQISLRTLLKDWFFRMHDPTTKNQQGEDIGSQYRSTIFFQNESEKALAQDVIKEIDDSGKWKRPITTTLEPRSEFYSAEDYHQDYLLKNPEGYSCHFLR